MAKKKTPKKAAKQKAPKKPKLLTSAELAKKLKVSGRQVSTYVKEGAPFTTAPRKKGQGGKAPRVFVLAEVESWLAGRVQNRKVGSEAIEGLSIPEPQPLSDKELDDLKKKGIVGALARLRGEEIRMHQSFKEALSSENYLAAKALHSLYMDTTKELRLMEKDTPGILEDRGEAIPLETVIDEARKVDIAIKRALLAVPIKISSQYSSAMTREELEILLKDEINECLRHITSGK